MKNTLLLIASLLGSTSAAAQTVENPEKAAPAAIPVAAPERRAVPYAVPTNRPPTILFQKTGIDIPQWAKDAGHNGWVYHWVTVEADGRVSAVELSESSGSPAIDEAASNRIKTARFSAAYDQYGKHVVQKERIRLEYFRWDDESPGGGLDDYLCSDLVKEFDFFRKTHGKASKPIYPLENYYVGWEMLKNVEQVDLRDRPAKEKQRAKYQKRWLNVVNDCRKTPTKRVLDRVEDPNGFKGLAESF
jgi:TonB family protein